MQAIFARTALTSNGWRQNVAVEIDDAGRIARVMPDSTPGSDAAQVPVLLPAASNLHSHTFQRAMAGLAERRGPQGRDSFWTWREIMYRFLDLLSPDDIEAVAAFAFMEMQEAGFAAVAEFHYVHHQPGGTPYTDIGELAARIAAAASETGIGLTLLPVLYTFGGVDGRPLKGGQQRFGNDVARFEKLLARSEECIGGLPSDTRLGVAPHSLRAVARNDLRAVAAMRPDTPLHMHIAEQEPEIEEVLAAYGKRPVEWLLAQMEVDEHWCLIHCTHMTDDETRNLAQTGAVAGLCPVTEANLGDGIFNGPQFRAAGGALGIGSDSNIRITVAEELRQLEYSQRLRDRARVVLPDHGQSTGRTLYDAALAGGSRALGRDAGALEVGRWADLVAIDPASHAGMMADDGILDGWLFTGSNDAVTDLWSAGRHRVRGGRHVAREAVSARYAKALERLMGSL
ncbi:formimidoylglutamate deiminase [Nitratireductor pacificus]|uniref:N-formimino-L-glutamate deiminase n=1 Tax=Nitratireductor pacificus pht-3B TaxID=391937 RepID=K2M9R6_9HYPH|nr:formimidoylglutamate deiminase [Nitratireductor pacificus]EKF18886.1 N-formimino-L-glutamate deiminase [Nitratireductor pacificus pht-3B]